MTGFDSPEVVKGACVKSATSLRTVTLAVVGLLAVAWGLFLWFPADDSRQLKIDALRHRHNGDAVPKREVISLAPLATESIPTDRADVTPGTIRLKVYDRGGMPVAGAVVSRCLSAGARNLSSSDQIGATNAAGFLSIPLVTERGQEDRGLLAVRADGFVPTSIPRPLESGTFEVRLVKGSRLLVQCRDYSGRSLAGVGVAMSQVLIPCSLPRMEGEVPSLPGSDGVSTIKYGVSGASGEVEFEGLCPGRYYVRAESKRYLLAFAENGQATLDVPEGSSQHVLVCGTVCVAALSTNVSVRDVLVCNISSDGQHVSSGHVVEALDNIRKSIEARYQNCQAIACLAKSANLGSARFQVAAIGYDQIDEDVPLVPADEFQGPEAVIAVEGVRPPTGEVCFRVEGDHSAPRGKLRLSLVSEGGRSNGIACIEGESRVVPSGRYTLDTNDKEMARAIKWPRFIDVPAGGSEEVKLMIRDGLFPVRLTIKMPELLLGQYVSINVDGPGISPRKGRTRLGGWSTWLPSGTYQVSCETPGCHTFASKLMISGDGVTTLDVTLVWFK